MKLRIILVRCIFCTFIVFVSVPTIHSQYIPASRMNRLKSNNRCSKVSIPNGSMVLKHRGRVAKFTCNPGYRLIGDRIATCHFRTWDAIPDCVKNVKCPEEMPKVLNGLMIPYKVVYFKIVCNPGYNVSDGSQTIFPCEEFYAPYHRPLICHLTATNFCDFEEGMCGWNNTIPYFSWIRHQNATPSHDLHTGPSSDHTTGTGHYLYIEASGLSDYEERFAKLTHRFSKIDTPEVCFIFWYHMYGFNIGTLDVYVDYVKVFTKTGNLGNKWRKGIIQKLPSERDFYISFVATTANGFAGDIAIDDIGLVNSTDCTKTLLVERSCRYRCFDPEPNATLCKCSSECLIESTCCADFMRYCSLENYESTTSSDMTKETSDFTLTDQSMAEIAITSNIETSSGSTNQELSTESYTIGTNDLTSDHSSITYETTVTNQAYTNYFMSSETTENSSKIFLQTNIWSGGEASSTEQYNDVIKITELSGSKLRHPEAATQFMRTKAVTEQNLWASSWVETSSSEATEDIRGDLTTIERETMPSFSEDLPTIQTLLKNEDRTPIAPTKTIASSSKAEQVPNITQATTSNKIDVSKRTALSKLNIPTTPETTTIRKETSELLPLAETNRPPRVNVTIFSTTASVNSGKFNKTQNVTKSNGVEKLPQTTATAIHIRNEPERPIATTESVTSSKPAITTTQRLGTLVSRKLNLLAQTELRQSTFPQSELRTTIANEKYSTGQDYRNVRLTTIDEDVISFMNSSSDELYQDVTEATEPTESIESPTERHLSSSASLEAKKRGKWKSSYIPKGRYTFSAVKSESQATAYVSILIITLLLLSAAILTGYLFSRRRRSTQQRLREDITEESDVLYMTSNDFLDFNVGLPSQPQSDRTSKQYKSSRNYQLSPSSSDLSL